jgi:hypothetical protein
VEWDEGEIRRVGVEEREVGFGVGPYDFRRHFVAVGKPDAEGARPLARELRHVVVRQDVPLVAHDNPGADALRRKKIARAAPLRGDVDHRGHSELRRLRERV